VAPRTALILREAAACPVLGLPREIAQALLELENPGYSVDDTWQALGLPAQQEPARSALHAYWRARFFSDSYLIHDRPYPGTAQFVSELHALGAQLVYLTGRDEPGMKQGTLRNLERDGFPLGAGTRLAMKDRRETDDVVHKVGTARRLAETAPVIASFENEPKNFVALFDAFPDAVHVFVDTVCSTQPARAVQGALCIRGFAVATRQPV
jgi:hypothetical protein